MVAVNEAEIVEIIDDLIYRFDRVYVYIFWITFSISVFMILFFIVMFVYWIRHLKLTYKLIKGINTKIMSNAGKPFLMEGINMSLINAIEGDSKNTNKLKLVYRNKLLECQMTEWNTADERYADAFEKVSRPNDNFYYIVTEKRIHCTNKMQGISKLWLESMNKLKDH